MMMSASNIQSAVEPQHRDDHNAAVSWSDRADDAVEGRVNEKIEKNGHYHRRIQGGKIDECGEMSISNCSPAAAVESLPSIITPIHIHWELSKARKDIVSFVPDILMTEVVQRYKLADEYDDDDSPDEPHSSMFRGACMIADISGFTKLSGSYCDRGKEGLDLLQNATSGYIGSLVETVYRHGGDVIKFAGDALVCVFRPDRPVDGPVDVGTIATSHSTSGEPVSCNEDTAIASTQPESDKAETMFRAACMAAVQCAWELKDISTDLLSLHVGVSCGDICFAMLGGHENKWECLISGRCLSELSRCLEDAPGKHVAVTGSLYEVLRGNGTGNGDSSGLEVAAPMEIEANGDLLPSGNRLLRHVRYVAGVSSSMKCPDSRFSLLDIADDGDNDDTKVLAQLSSYVPWPVTQALIAGTLTFLSELREVTTLFMRWDGYDLEEVEDLINLQQYFYQAQEILGEHGGFIRQFLVDDKGCVLIALWGVPTATFPDNGRRAVQAAVLLSEKLRAMGMPTSSGITTGTVYCGTVGSELRREYCAVGDVVNLAARLMSRAQGGILVDEATQSRLPAGGLKSSLVRQKPMKLKGKEGRLYEPYKFMTIFDCAPPIGSATDTGLRTAAGSSNFSSTAIVREVIREAALPRLNSLISSSWFQQMGKMGSSSSSSASAISSSSCVDYLVIEGRIGTGCEEAAAWLLQGCTGLGVRCVSVKLTKQDAVSDFQAMAKLFRELLGPEVYDDPIKQPQAIEKLLDEMYPGDIESRNRVALPVLVNTMGLRYVSMTTASQQQELAALPSSSPAPVNALSSQHRPFSTEGTDKTSDRASLISDGIAAVVTQSHGRKLSTTNANNVIGDSIIHISDDMHMQSTTHSAQANSVRSSISNGGDGLLATTSIDRPSSLLPASTIPTSPSHQSQSPAPEVRATTTSRRSSQTPLQAEGEGSQKSSLGGASHLSAPHSGPFQALSPIRPDGLRNRSRSISYRSSLHGSSTRGRPVTRSSFISTGTSNPNPTKPQTFKMPIRIVRECLRDIFKKLMELKAIVIIIENAHEIDESSYKLLLSFHDMDVKVLFVLMQQPLTALNNSSTQQADISIVELFNPEASVSYDWLVPYQNRLLQFDRAEKVVLPNYTEAEVTHILSASLKVQPGKLPASLVRTVVQLSGGNPFWVKEMASFIETYGLEEFMSSVADQNSNRRSRREDRLSASAVRGSFFLSPFGAMAQSVVSAVGTLVGVRANREIHLAGANALMSAGTFSGALDKDIHRHSNSMVYRDEDQHSSAPFDDQQTAASANLNAVESADSKLTQLVVCRFEKLSIDEQNVCRCAAIVGNPFSVNLLALAVSSNLVPYLKSILRALIETHWVCISNDDTATTLRPAATLGSHHGDRVDLQYSFMHPLVHKILYGLTPSSVRNQLHASLARGIEANDRTNNAYFASLGYHYSKSGSNPKKSYEYLSRAANEVLNTNHSNVDEAIRLICAARQYADASHDFAALLGLVTKCTTRINDDQAKKAQLDSDATQSSSLRESGRRRSSFFMFGTKPTAVVASPAPDATATPQADRKAQAQLNFLCRLEMKLELSRSELFSQVKMPSNVRKPPPTTTTTTTSTTAQSQIGKMSRKTAIVPVNDSAEEPSLSLSLSIRSVASDSSVHFSQDMIGGSRSGSGIALAGINPFPDPDLLLRSHGTVIEELTADLSDTGTEDWQHGLISLRIDHLQRQEIMQTMATRSERLLGSNPMTTTEEVNSIGMKSGMTKSKSEINLRTDSLMKPKAIRKLSMRTESSGACAVS